MGYIKQHTIVVTAYDNGIIKAHEEATRIFGEMCSPIIPSKMNGYKSFFIAPDGSKEGWADSNEGDLKRDEFVNWINSCAYEDGSNSVDFVELFYGEDNGRCSVVRHN